MASGKCGVGGCLRVCTGCVRYVLWWACVQTLGQDSVRTNLSKFCKMPISLPMRNNVSLSGSMSPHLVQCDPIWPTVCLSWAISAYLAKSLPIWSNVCLSGQTSGYLEQCLPIWSNVTLSGQLSAYLEQFPPIWPNVCLSGAMSVYLVKCLAIWSNVCLSGPMSPYLASGLLSWLWVFQLNHVCLPPNRLSVSLHCKKRFAIFLCLAGMSLTKLSLVGKN